MVTCLFTASGGTQGAADAPPPILALYRQTIKAMDDLKEPPYVTYRLESTSEGLRGDFYHCPGTFFCTSLGNNTNHWMLWHRTNDFHTAILDLDNNRRYDTDTTFFDPTWYGPYRALRIGMINVPRVAPSALPSTSPIPASSLPVIGTVSVFSPGIYEVSDRGDTTCPNGDPGHAVHLTSRTRNPLHQLSDAIINLKWTRFCSVRLTRHGGGALAGNTTHWEGHYGEVGSYWMLTDGFVDESGRIVGVSTRGGTWRFRLFDMRFPESLPPDTFSPVPTATPGTR